MSDKSISSIVCPWPSTLGSTIGTYVEEELIETLICLMLFECVLCDLFNYTNSEEV